MLCLVHVKVYKRQHQTPKEYVDPWMMVSPTWMAEILCYYCSFLPTLFLNQWLPIVAEMLKFSMKELLDCSYLHLEISDPLLHL